MAETYFGCIGAIKLQAEQIYAKFEAPKDGVMDMIELHGEIVEARLRMTPSVNEEKTDLEVINFMVLGSGEQKKHCSFSVFPLGGFAIAQFVGARPPKNETRKARPDEDAYARQLIAAGAIEAPIRALTVTGLRHLAEDFEIFSKKVLS